MTTELAACVAIVPRPRAVLAAEGEVVPPNNVQTTPLTSFNQLVLITVDLSTNVVELN
jgi:hypothetical protein